MKHTNWDIPKDNYKETIYTYLSNIVVPHSRKSANAVWLYGIQRYLTGKLSFEELSLLANDIYIRLDISYLDDAEFELFINTDKYTNEQKKEIQIYLEDTYKLGVTNIFFVDFKKINKYLLNFKVNNDEDENAALILHEYSEKKLSIGELSILAQDLIESNIPKGPLMNYDILHLAAEILPTYYYNEKRAVKLIQVFNKQLNTSITK